MLVTTRWMTEKLTSRKLSPMLSTRSFCGSILRVFVLHQDPAFFEDICKWSLKCFFFFQAMKNRTKKIFVGGVPTDMTMETLQEYFQQFGEVWGYGCMGMGVGVWVYVCAPRHSVKLLGSTQKSGSSRPSEYWSNTLPLSYGISVCRN